VVDGGSTDGSLEEIKALNNPKIKVIPGDEWKEDFTWDILARNRNIGFNSCDTDWAISFDADYVFHERTQDKFIKVLDRSLKNPIPPMAVKMMKNNLISADRYFVKGGMPLCVNKKDYPNLKYGLSYDSRSTFMIAIDVDSKKNGIYIGESIAERSGMILSSEAEIWVYDYTFMTPEICERITARNLLAKERITAAFITRKRKKYLKRDAFNFFKKFMSGRGEHSDTRVIGKISHHPKWIQSKIKAMDKTMFGWDTFGFTNFRARYFKK